MEAGAVDDALAQSPLELLAGDGGVYDVLTRIVELGGPAAASAVVAAIPAMARAGPKAWDLAWYYMVCTRYEIYMEEWVMPFFELRRTPDAQRIHDYWRRVYIACSMLVRIAWVATYEFLMSPEAILSIQPDTSLIESIARVFGVDVPKNMARPDIDIMDPEFPEDTSLATYALESQRLDKSIPFGYLSESLVLPPGSEPTEEIGARAVDVHSKLPIELAGRVSFEGPVTSIRAPARTSFPVLLRALIADGTGYTTYNFGDIFTIVRHIDESQRYTAFEHTEFYVGSAFRLAGFNAAAVLALWHDDVNETMPSAVAWFGFGEVARSRSSAMVGDLITNSRQVRFELGELAIFGARRNDTPQLALLLGDENGRPEWMEKLGMKVAHNPRAAVTLAVVVNDEPSATRGLSFHMDRLDNDAHAFSRWRGWLCEEKSAYRNEYATRWWTDPAFRAAATAAGYPKKPVFDDMPEAEARLGDGGIGYNDGQIGMAAVLDLFDPLPAHGQLYMVYATGEEDAVEMAMTLTTHAKVPFTVHMGITRSFRYMLDGHRLHKDGLAMQLHLYAARHSARVLNKDYLTSTPVPLMRELFERHHAAFANIWMGPSWATPIKAPSTDDVAIVDDASDSVLWSSREAGLSVDDLRWFFGGQNNPNSPKFLVADIRNMRALIRARMDD